MSEKEKKNGDSIIGEWITTQKNECGRTLRKSRLVKRRAEGRVNREWDEVVDGHLRTAYSVFSTIEERIDSINGQAMQRWNSCD